MTRQPDRTWNPELDDRVRQLRASGLTWAAVGAEIGRDGGSCRQRLKRIGEPDPMPSSVSWTPEVDAQLRTLRAAGLSWAAIGKQVDRCEKGCRRRLLLTLGEPDPLDAADVAPNGKRDPVPPGHPSTWGALVAGTVLEGREYR